MQDAGTVLEVLRQRERGIVTGEPSALKECAV
jgi:hypothetical protein